jgi:hypothetical protein
MNANAKITITNTMSNANTIIITASDRRHTEWEEKRGLSLIIGLWTKDHGRIFQHTINTRTTDCENLGISPLEVPFLFLTYLTLSVGQSEKSGSQSRLRSKIVYDIIFGVSLKTGTRNGETRC